MSLIPTIYSSADPGAPQVSGTVASLISLLRAVLVNGYGSGADAKPAAGWTEEFVGVNVAAFRNNPTSGTGYRLRVDDTTTTYARLRGYEVMTDVDTGTGPVPTVAQMSNGTFVAKSSAASAASRLWWAIGNERVFYLFIDDANLGMDAGRPMWFGDIASVIPGDRHHFGVSRLSSATGAIDSFNADAFLQAGVSSPAAYIGRKSDQVLGAATLGICRSAYSGNNPYLGYEGLAYPWPASGGKLYYDRVHVRDGAFALRGSLPGLYIPLHKAPFADLALLDSVPGLAPGTVLVAKTFAVNTSGVRGQVLFDTVNEW